MKKRAPELPHCTDHSIKCHWKCEVKCYLKAATPAEVTEALKKRMKEVLDLDEARYG